MCVWVTICCGTLCYSLSFNNQTDQADESRDGGFAYGGMRDGEIEKGQIGEGGCEETFLCLKGLSHEIDFKNVDENGQILALTRAAAGF